MTNIHKLNLDIKLKKLKLPTIIQVNADRYFVIIAPSMSLKKFNATL